MLELGLLLDTMKKHMREIKQRFLDIFKRNQLVDKQKAFSTDRLSQEAINKFRDGIEDNETRMQYDVFLESAINILEKVTKGTVCALRLLGIKDRVLVLDKEARRAFQSMVLKLPMVNEEPKVAYYHPQYEIIVLPAELVEEVDELVEEVVLEEFIHYLEPFPRGKIIKKYGKLFAHDLEEGALHWYLEEILGRKTNLVSLGNLKEDPKETLKRKTMSRNWGHAVSYLGRDKLDQLFWNRKTSLRVNGVIKQLRKAWKG